MIDSVRDRDALAGGPSALGGIDAGPGSDPAGVRPIDRLIAIMRRLRDPDTGCPWDVTQTFETIAPYTVEEAYEVADAIARGDRDDLLEELGDLLLQVIYHAQISAEKGLFGFDEIADGIADKLVRRHPHVFGNTDASDPEAVKRSWDAIKAAERAAKDERRRQLGLPSRPAGVLDAVPVALPALSRADKLQKAAAKVGFDWRRDADGEATLRNKINEELDELHVELERRAGGAPGADAAAAAEFGDLLFALVNFGRRAGIDPEAALAATNQKFARRFRAMEERAASEGLSLADLDLGRQEALWQAVKRREATGAASETPGSDQTTK